MTTSFAVEENIARLLKDFGKITDEDKQALEYLNKQKKNKQMIDNYNAKLKNNLSNLVFDKNISLNYSNNSIANSTSTNSYEADNVFLNKEQKDDFKELVKLIHIHMICLKNGIKINKDNSFTRNNEQCYSGLNDNGYKKMEELFNKLKDYF